MKALQRPGRTAAVVGAVVAVSATTLMGFAGTALARVPGTCTENVNVRAEPNINSRIVALCEAGTAVETGATRDGWVRIMDLGGWASAEYISIDGAAPGSTGPAPATAPSTGPTPADDAEDETGAGAGDELRQEPAGTDPSTPSTTGRDAAGTGPADETPGRNSFTPDERGTPDGPGTPDEDAPTPGLGGLL